MKWNRPAWWSSLRRSRLSREPGAALFQGLRVRLTFWYCLVLCAALVLFSVALYFSVQHFLLSPIEIAAAKSADAHVNQWPMDQYDHGCNPSNFSGHPGQYNPPPIPGQPAEIIACFDQDGSLITQDGYTTSLPAAFLDDDLAQAALQSPSGQANGIVDGGSVGQIYRFAEVVPNPAGNGNAGVVVVGEYIQAQENELSLLLTLLFAIGGVALVGAGLGGLFLSNRALVPARLSWANQQRFIADAAHELRTPLTLLRADAEVLLRGREHLEDDDAALLEDIVAEAHHMSNLATSLLTLARLDTGSIHREHEVVDLAALVREGARRVQAFAEQKSVTVHVESSNDIYIIGDSVLLEQAMLVLLDNAIKYNRPGGLVTVRAVEEDGKAILEVRDTGIGIAAEHLPHLGERFYRVDKARSREAGGTGLGLSIAQRIALAHSGRLTLSSVPEQGTTVTIALPQAGREHPREVEVHMSSLPEK